MDSTHNLDSHYSDTTNSTTSTATALHLNLTNNNTNADDGGGGGGGGLAPPRNMANRRTSLADIISRVRRTSAGLQANHPLQPLTESKSELPHYSIPAEKFADKRVKVKLCFRRRRRTAPQRDRQLTVTPLPFAETQHPRYDGGGGGPETAPRN